MEHDPETAPQRKLKRLCKAQDVDLAANRAQVRGDVLTATNENDLDVEHGFGKNVGDVRADFESEGDEVDMFNVRLSENLDTELDFGQRDDSKLYEETEATVAISELGRESTKRKPVEDDDDDEPIASIITKKIKPSGKEMEEFNADPDPKARRTKKSTKKELEEMHAESQRLLRETKQVAFEPAPMVHVPMSGLLAKLRLRKIQLGWKSVASTTETKLHSPNPASPGSLNDGFATENHPETNFRDEGAVEPASLEACTLKHDSVSVDVELNVDVSTSGNGPSTSENYVGMSNAPEEPICSLVKCSTTFRQPLEDTQDIFSDSVCSFENDMHEADLVSNGPSMNLHLDTDTETQDEDFGRLNEEETLAANRPLFSFGTKPQIMALIDDEAEVEDEEILAKDSDDEDDDDAELLEIVEPAHPERPADISKRAELHRQWLEQQDEAQTDDILCRLKGNLKSRGVADEVASILDEEDSIPYSSSIESKRQPKEKTSRFHYEVDTLNGSNDAAFNMQKNTEAKLDDDENASSDDEETERVILRHRLLEAAEQQELFTSPAEDEASREMLGFIKKLNVASTTKSKPAQAPPEIRGFGTSLHGTCKSKPAFLNRVVSSSSVHKQTVCTNSRSFIFGRDDSSDEMAKGGSFSNAVGKENVVVKTIEVQSSTQANICGEQGPSLFSILRQQAADSGRSSQDKNQTRVNERIVMTDRISIFSKFSSRGKLNPKA